jgi:hypothetical protein
MLSIIVSKSIHNYDNYVYYKYYNKINKYDKENFFKSLCRNMHLCVCDMARNKINIIEYYMTLFNFLENIDNVDYFYNSKISDDDIMYFYENTILYLYDSVYLNLDKSFEYLRHKIEKNTLHEIFYVLYHNMYKYKSSCVSTVMSLYEKI